MRDKTKWGISKKLVNIGKRFRQNKGIDKVRHRVGENYNNEGSTRSKVKVRLGEMFRQYKGSCIVRSGVGEGLNRWETKKFER